MLGSPLPAITVFQPWATLIAEGLKPFEFRSWTPPARLIGRRIAIHAAARPVRLAEVKTLIYRLEHIDWRETGLIDLSRSLDLLDQVFGAPRALPLASVLCIATLGRPVRDAELADRMGISVPRDLGNGVHTNWGWPLHDIEVLHPFVPAHGARRIWTWQRAEPTRAQGGAE